MNSLGPIVWIVLVIIIVLILGALFGSFLLITRVLIQLKLFNIQYVPVLQDVWQDRMYPLLSDKSMSFTGATIHGRRVLSTNYRSYTWAMSE